MKSFIYSILCVLIFVSTSSRSQKLVDVNLLTGTAQVTIPVYVVRSGDISVPIAFSYSASGIKVEDYGQHCGLGWELNAEPCITRIMKCYPDDLVSGSYSGWLNISGLGTNLEGFSISNDGNSSTCSDEVSDYSYINTYFPFNYDTEPDIFIVSAPGLSFEFVFDKNHDIKVVPYQDVIVTYTSDGAGRLESFAVTNDQGIKYTFGQRDSISRRVTENVTPDVFKRDYYFFHVPSHPTTWEYLYNSKWYLTKIEDTKGNTINYSYYVMMDARFNDDGTSIPDPPITTENVDIVKYNPSNSTYEKQHIYANNIGIDICRIRKITAASAGETVPSIADVEFVWQDTVSSASKLTRILLPNEGRYVDLEYLNPSSNTSWGRSFLKKLNFTPSLLNVTDEYKFSYSDVNESNGTAYFTGYDSITNAQDYWGYYNGYPTRTNLHPKMWVYPDNSSVDEFRITEIPSYGGNVVMLDGYDRSANTNAIAGTLTKIIYPNGGVTVLDYELNTFLDKDINSAISGGGIRISKITNNDGLNTNDVTNYSYNDPSTSVTTGRALSMPKFAFAIPNSNSYSTLSDRVKNSVYRVERDLSDESTGIIYGKVTVSKTNGGKSRYEFNTDGTWGGSSVNEWSETCAYVTRPYTSNPSPCNPISPDFLKNGKGNYPFAPNPNYDYERGQLLHTYLYNESGDLVKKEDYTFQRSYTTPTTIQALKYDNLFGDIVYAKYNVISATSNLLASRAARTYNSASYTSTIYTTDAETYSYESSNHKLVTKMQKDNSDGTTLVSRFKYVKDYSSTTGGDTYNQALYNLKNNNVNAIVENYTSVINGGSEKVIKGSLATYKSFTNPTTSASMYLPYESWSFNSQAGVDYNVSGGFYPSSISSGNFTQHSGYIKSNTILGYDRSGVPLGAIGTSRIAATIIEDPLELIRVAQFSNAKPDEVLCTSFDFQNSQYAFTVNSGNTIETPGHASQSCLGFSSSSSITGSISKASTNSDIIFSCWIKDASSSGSLTIALTATGFSQNYTLNYSSGSDWKYYEKKIPKPTSSTILLTVQTSQNIKIDDILVYPGNSIPQTASYSKKSAGLDIYGKFLTAEAGLNGSIKYYEYDASNRPLVIRDGFNNIVERKAYKGANESLSMSTPTIDFNSIRINGTATFTVNGNSDISGITYKWNYGDGSAEAVTATNTTTHVYTSAGAFTITCTQSAPAYSNVSVSTPTGSGSFYVSVIPYICVAGIIERTADNQCITSTCTGITGTCYSTRFKVGTLTGGTLSSIVWETAEIGGNTWTSIGTSTPILVSFGASDPSYRIRCTVTCTNGATGTSDEFFLYNYYQ